MKDHTAPLVSAELAARLIDTYRHLGDGFHGIDGAALPSEQEVKRIVGRLRELLFPGLAGAVGLRRPELQASVQSIIHDVALALRHQICASKRYVHRHANGASTCLECETCADDITRDFLDELPALREALARDADAALFGDPAAHDRGEVILCYPGHLAITVHRLAHALHRRGVPLLPRMMTEYAHRVTGIDIHPGARIGDSFFIDHGTGVVVGETTHIGDRVRLYQGVTLGALSLPSHRVAKLRGGAKRHPTLEDDVVVYAGATILGGDTVIGKGSVIGGNCWVVESVAPGSRVSVQMGASAPRPSAPAPDPANAAAWDWAI